MGLQRGEFRECFRDLREFARANGVEGLKALEDTLSKSDVSDAPVFEAFGIKFPANLAVVGGTIILLSVQVYFYLYLRKLSGSLRKDHPGWDVPWIGMDPSVLAQTIFFITVSLFPAGTLLGLAVPTSLRLTRGYRENVGHPFEISSVLQWHWTVKLEVACLTIPVVLSAVLGVFCWRCRPQLSGDSSSDSMASPADVTDIDANEI